MPASHVEKLQGFRRRLAATEIAGTVRAIGEAASELALTAPEDLLEDIGTFIDRVHEKLERIAPMTVPRVKSQHRSVGFNAQGFSTITMRKSDWVTDSQGVQSRCVWNAADGASPPS
jgi:hypothetical protein